PLRCRAAGAAPPGGRRGMTVSASRRAGELGRSVPGWAKALATGLGGAGVGYALEEWSLGRQRSRAVAKVPSLPAAVHHHLLPTDDGGRLHVVELGQGPPIVLLHGFMLSARSWAPQLRSLSAHHRVLAVDLRGHGRSRPGEGGFGIARLAADVAGLLEAFELSGAVVVGHSMGGMTALTLAADHPAVTARRVSGLALVATSGGPMTAVPGWQALARAMGPIERAGARVLGSAASSARPSDLAWWATRAAFGRQASPEQVSATWAMTAATPPTTVGALVEEVLSFDRHSALAGIGVPSVVVSGTDDRLTPPWHARRLAGGLAQAELRLVPGAGHMVIVERPSALVDALDSLAARVPTGGAAARR
ncbi:MAG: alpha/beta fold hydrolase, partial [Acidimicrobiales bacterium]